MLTPEQINELHRLDDAALVNTHEAAAFLGQKSETLAWNRCHAPHRCPSWQVLGNRLIRYRMGDLRAHVVQKGG